MVDIVIVAWILCDVSVLNGRYHYYMIYGMFHFPLLKLLTKDFHPRSLTSKNKFECFLLIFVY